MLNQFFLHLLLTVPCCSNEIQTIKRKYANDSDSTKQGEIEIDIPMIIVGNKMDLEQIRRVAVYEGKLMARKFNALFMEASAKTGENVEVE